MTTRATTGLLWLLVFVTILAFSTSKPELKPASSYFTLCSRDNAEALSECIRKNIIALKSSLRKGIAILGIPALDPAFFPKIVFNSGGSIAVNTKLTNVIMKGLHNFTLNRVKAKVDDRGLSMNVSILVPDLRVTGNYEMDGRLLVIPIKGNGHFEINNTDLVIDIHSFSKAVTRDGKEYLEVSEVTSNLDLKGKSRTWFFNLFNGDKLLGDVTNNFLNEHYLESHEATKFMPEGIMSEVYMSMINTIFSHFSIDELFVK